MITTRSVNATWGLKKPGINKLQQCRAGLDFFFPCMIGVACSVCITLCIISSLRCTVENVKISFSSRIRFLKSTRSRTWRQLHQIPFPSGFSSALLEKAGGHAQAVRRISSFVLETGGNQNETGGSCRLESVKWLINFLESDDVQSCPLNFMIPSVRHILYDVEYNGGDPKYSWVGWSMEDWPPLRVCWDTNRKVNVHKIGNKTKPRMWLRLYRKT